MSKQIRPLRALKKHIGEDDFKRLYNIWTEGAVSKKDKENTFYWMYSYSSLSKNENNFFAESFFWKNVEEKNNILTITELGRLLLTGLYYDINDYTKEVGEYIYRAYYKKLNAGESFNDLEYYETVKHIRENIGYYYNNQPEVKYFILESLFKKDLQELLPPPPEKLLKHNKAIEFFTEIRKNQRKVGIDAWINRAEDWEGYCYYLHKLLDSYNLPYLNFKDWKAEDSNKGDVNYWEEIEALKKDYRDAVLNNTKQLMNKII